MNRRMALMLTLLSGGLLPSRLLAQDRALSRRRDDDPYRRPSSRGPERLAQAETEPLIEEDAAPTGGGQPQNFPEEAGAVLRTWDISKYTSLPHSDSNPQNAILEWIFRSTGSSVWHGDRIAALSAGKAQVRAYNTPKILDQTHRIVERFNDAEFDILQVRARFVAAADPRWRYLVYTRLKPLASGPQGQQVWSLSVADAEMVLAQMQVYQSFKYLADRTVKIANGQTLSVVTPEVIDYVSGPQRDSASGLGFQPTTGRLTEGVSLRFSPLLTYAGDELDAAIDLRATTVKKLHATKILAPREIGPVDMTIDVPEVTYSHLNLWSSYESIKGWKLGQTLLISAGIQPGILQKKTGFLNLRIPGTVPTDTELLVFLDVDTVSTTAPARRRSEG